jgi:8-oxo-dGTP pyrophosphatase MutT (NUDIX family)
MTQDAPASRPRLAATVLLLREREAGLEVLMMRRGSGLSFMAGMWVFPGGRLEATDHVPAMLARLPTDASARCRCDLCDMHGGRLPQEVALGLHVAACRETFEESGLLLARRAGGDRVTDEETRNLGGLRVEVARDPAIFLGLLEREQLLLDVSPFVYWSHWITPSLEPKRFDTHFFAVQVAGEEWIQADLGELTEHRWIRPRDAIEALGRGEMNMVPPTVLTLEDLAESHARSGGLAAMLQTERLRRIPPITPRIAVENEGFRVVMPWDPGYLEVPGEGVAVSPAEIPSCLASRPSSVTVRRGLGVRQK